MRRKTNERKNRSDDPAVPVAEKETKETRVEYESFRPGFQFNHNGTPYTFDSRTFSVRSGQKGYIETLDRLAKTGVVWRRGQQPENAEIEEEARLEIPAPGAQTPYYIGVKEASRADLLRWLETVYPREKFGDKYKVHWLRRWVEQELNILPSLRGKRQIPRR